MSCDCDGPGADQRHIGRQSNLGNEYNWVQVSSHPPSFLFADFMLKPWIHKPPRPPQKKTKDDKTTEKKQPKRKKKVPCLFFLLFFGPMGLAETIAIFFSAFLECAQIFKKQTFMNRTLQLFLVISILSL